MPPADCNHCLGYSSVHFSTSQHCQWSHHSLQSNPNPTPPPPRSGIHDERVGLLHNVFCSISQRFSMPLKSGLNCGQGLSENDVLWSLNNSFTINSVIVVLEYAREEKRQSNPLMEKSVHSVHLATLNIDLNHSVIELI